jgi:acetoacetyl-CoA reductase
MKRVAIVTGGTRGLGRAMSVALQAQGAVVAAIYHGNDVAAEQFHKETGLHVFKWDVSDFEACRSGVSQVQAQLGPVDILVNNAGITQDAMFHYMKLEQWDQVLRTNLGSMFNMCRNLIAGMRERGFGRIVNISSVNGQKGQIGQTNYAAAKAGIIGFTKALALEGARKGITANVVAPGYCDTEMVAHVPDEVRKAIIAQIPVGRLGTAAEVASLVAFLAREDASFITGATFSANGGQYLA